MTTDSAAQSALKSKAPHPPPRPRWATAADPDPERRATRFSREVGEVFLLRNATEQLVVSVCAVGFEHPDRLEVQFPRVTTTVTPAFVDVRRVSPRRLADDELTRVEEPGGLSADNADELAELLRRAATLARKINAEATR